MGPDSGSEGRALRRAGVAPLAACSRLHLCRPRLQLAHQRQLGSGPPGSLLYAMHHQGFLGTRFQPQTGQVGPTLGSGVCIFSSTQQIGCASLGPFEDIKEHIPRRGPGLFAKVHMRSLVV